MKMADSQGSQHTYSIISESQHTYCLTLSISLCQILTMSLSHSVGEERKGSEARRAVSLSLWCNGSVTHQFVQVAKSVPAQHVISVVVFPGSTVRNTSTEHEDTVREGLC